MKKIFFILTVTLTSICSAFAQSSDYKAFKVDVGGLYAIPSGDGAKAGAGFYIEPKYNITNNIALGLKFESAIMAAADDVNIGGIATISSLDISAVSTYQITGDYYFNENKVRPFAGLGLGIYNLGDIEFGTEEANFEIGSKFGFAPRAGILLGHFRLALEYNIITGVDTGLDAFDNKNYLSFKVGFEIGGGRK